VFWSRLISVKFHGIKGISTGTSEQPCRNQLSNAGPSSLEWLV